MKALIDTNLALTFITGREDPYSEQTERIMELCSKDRFEGFLAFHSLSVIWYLMRKVPMSLRRKAIKKLCELLTLSGADNKTVLAANANTDFADFEALERYKNDPRHQAVSRLCKSIRTDRGSVDFIV